MRNLLFLVALAFTLSSPLSLCAEMVLCDGVWTNSSCDGTSENKLGAKPELNQEQLAQAAERSKKRSLLHDITMKSIEAKRVHGVDLSIESVQEVCRSAQTTISDCREAIEKFSDRLSQRVTQAIQIAEAKKKEAREDKVEVVSQPSTVVIIEDRTHHRRRHHGSHYEHNNAHHNSEHQQMGASINIHGQSADGRVKAGINVNSAHHRKKSEGHLGQSTKHQQGKNASAQKTVPVKTSSKSGVKKTMRR